MLSVNYEPLTILAFSFTLQAALGHAGSNQSVCTRAPVGATRTHNASSPVLRTTELDEKMQTLFGRFAIEARI